MPACEEERHCTGHANLSEDLPARGAERAEHVAQLGLERGEADGDVDRHREEGQQERGEHGGHRADAEPHDEQRDDRRLGNAVESHQERIDRVVDRCRAANGEAQEQAEADRGHESQQCRHQRVPGVKCDGPRGARHRQRDTARRRQHDRLDAEHHDRALPRQHEPDEHGQRQDDAASPRAHHAAVSRAGRICSRMSRISSLPSAPYTKLKVRGRGSATRCVWAIRPGWLAST